MYLSTTSPSSFRATLKKNAESRLRPTGHCITGSEGRVEATQLGAGSHISSSNAKQCIVKQCCYEETY